MISFRPGQEKRNLWIAGQVSLFTPLMLSLHLFWHQAQPQIKSQLQKNQIALAMNSTAPVVLTVVDIIMATLTVFALGVAGRSIFRILKCRHTAAYQEAERREAGLSFLVQEFNWRLERYYEEPEVDVVQIIREIEWEFVNIEQEKFEAIVDKYTQPVARQRLIKQIYNLDLEARKACISFLQEQYPTLSQEQAERLIFLIFEPNFKCHLPNHFGRLWKGRTFGYPFIWLLNELEVGGIRYLYRNGIWQIHWDVGSRYKGVIRHEEGKAIKYLVTRGPIGEEEQRLWEEHGLIFFEYSCPSSPKWQYPFPEDADLSGITEFLLSLKLADCSISDRRD